MTHSNLNRTPKAKTAHLDTETTPGKNEKDDIILILINGLNSLIEMAKGTDMGTAARILCEAREELVHWAVNMNFHESAKDRFINHQLYCSDDVMTLLGKLTAKTDQESLTRLLNAIEQYIRLHSHPAKNKHHTAHE